MRKKLFAILMSAMMMVTFMPTMAFAKVADPLEPYADVPSKIEQVSDNAGEGYHDFKKTSTIETNGCGEAYILYTCEDCGDQALFVDENAHHTWETVSLSGAEVAKMIANDAFDAINGAKDKSNALIALNLVDDFAKAVQKYYRAEKDTEEKEDAAVAAFFEDATKGVIDAAVYKAIADAMNAAIVKAAKDYVDTLGGECFYLVDTCKGCGIYDWDDVAISDHVRPADTPACAESYVCAKCGVTVAVTLPTKAERRAELLGQLHDALNQNDEDVTKAENIKRAIAALMDIQAPVAHKWVQSVKTAPCCTKTVNTCSVCGKAEEHFTAKYATKVGHNYTDYIVEPTCTTAGFKAQICTECGFINLDNVQEIAPLGHDAQEVVVEPTCTAPGYTQTVCARCDKLLSMKANFTKAKGHNYQFEMLLEPSCKTKNDPEVTEDGLEIGAGLYKAFCPDCGKTVYYHNMQTTIFTGFAHDLTAKKIPSTKATEHNFTVYEKMFDATCEDNEVWAKKCDKCGHFAYCTDFRTKSIANTALGHDKNVVKVGRTCEHSEGTITSCNRCKKILVEESDVEWFGGKCIPTGTWETTLDSTFTKVGTRVQYCKVCGGECKYDDVAKKTLAKAYQPTLKAGKKSFTAKFKNIGKAATGVQVAYKVAGANNYKYVKTTFKNSKTIKGLKSGKKYTVKVRKYVVEDGQTIYGKWCAVKYVKVK